MFINTVRWFCWILEHGIEVIKKLRGFQFNEINWNNLDYDEHIHILGGLDIGDQFILYNHFDHNYSRVLQPIFCIASAFFETKCYGWPDSSRKRRACIRKHSHLAQPWNSVVQGYWLCNNIILNSFKLIPMPGGTCFLVLPWNFDFPYS